MPVYYFDVETDQGCFEDTVGQTLGDREAVRREALSILAPMAQKALPCANGITLKVIVRNENRCAILLATLDLDTCWVA